MKQIALLVILLLLSISSFANGFETEQIHALQQKLNQDNKTLLQLAKGLVPGDITNENAMDVYDGGATIRDGLFEFEDLGYLYQRMVNAQDKATVRALIVDNKKFFAKRCDESIGYINENLSPIQNTVIITTVEQLRDHAQQACDLIKNWK